MGTDATDEIKTLVTRIKDFRAGLSDAQREYLDAILRVAGDIAAGTAPAKDPEFHKEFESAFEQQAVERVQQYVQLANEALGLPAATTLLPAPPFAAGPAHPAMITP